MMFHTGRMIANLFWKPKGNLNAGFRNHTVVMLLEIFLSSADQITVACVNFAVRFFSRMYF